MILAPEEQNIMGKIDKIGTPLREWDVQINYGIKTACNEVYIIDEATRQTLVKKHPKSKKLIFPILKDNTLRAYTIVWDNRYLINFHNGYTSFSGRIVEPCDPEDYPSIKAHIDKVAAELDMGVRRTRGGHKGSNRGFFARSDRGVTPYNLRNCAYIDAFSLPKIVWKQTSSMQTFTLDLEGRFLDVSGCFLWKQGMSDTQLKYLLGILNSRLAHYWFLQNAVAFGAKGIRWVPETVFRYPIPMISAAQEKRLARLVDRVLAAKTRNPEADTTELESEIDTLVYTLYGLTPEEIAILEKSP